CFLIAPGRLPLRRDARRMSLQQLAGPLEVTRQPQQTDRQQRLREWLRHRFLCPANQGGTLEGPARSACPLDLILQESGQVADHLREVASTEGQVERRLLGRDQGAPVG